MRTVYLGTSAFAVAVLERLADERPPAAARGHAPGPPARPRPEVVAPPVADAARALGIELIQPESVNSDEARAAIAAARPTRWRSARSAR